MGGSREIMAGCGWWRQYYGWSWVVVAELWLIVGGGGNIMVGCGWLWVVVTKLWLAMGGRGWWQQNYGWSWVVVDGRGWSHSLVMPIFKKLTEMPPPNCKIHGKNLKFFLKA